ncbi:MAG: site-2 protease family protein [Anaerolineae bacterium]
MNLFYILGTIFALLIAIDIHECAHAWTANELGDPTARYQGRISLNPLVHLDPMGTMLMVLSAISGFGIGWGKPVPVNPYRLRYGPRLGMGLVAASGPLSNLLLASVVAVPLRLGLPLPGFISLLLHAIATICIALAVFNLLPIFPLDGHSVLQGILSTIRARWAYQASNVLTAMEGPQGALIFFMLILVDQFLPFSILRLILGPPFTLLRRLILGY